MYFLKYVKQEDYREFVVTSLETRKREDYRFLYLQLYNSVIIVENDL